MLVKAKLDRPSAVADSPNMVASNRYNMPLDWIGQSAKLAARAGHDPMLALADAGVPHSGERLHDGTMLEPAQFLLLCTSVITTVGDEMHGAAACPMALGTASMAAKAMMSDASLGAGIETLSRFFVLTGGACAIRLGSTPSEAQVEIVANAERGLATSVIEELMAHFLVQQFSFFLGFPLPLSGFVTTARDHPTMERPHPYLLCSVEFGPVASLLFPRRYLSLPCAAKIVDGPLWDAQSFWLAHHPSTPLAGIDRSRSPIGAAIFDHLIEGDRPFDACCERLGIGRHEAQRRLWLEGWNYRRIRRAALLERSRPHLRAGVSSDDLATALGYSDQRSLRRALKLATGLSIRDLRANSHRPNETSGLVVERLRKMAMLMS